LLKNRKKKRDWGDVRGGSRITLGAPNLQTAGDRVTKAAAAIPPAGGKKKKKREEMGTVSVPAGPPEKVRRGGV